MQRFVLVLTGALALSGCSSSEGDDDDAALGGAGSGGARGSGAASSSGSVGGGATEPSCEGSGCPESSTARQSCHSDCDYSGFCWDVCETVFDYAVDDTICSDDVDNDSDGAVDCDDPDCQGHTPVCTPPGGAGSGSTGSGTAAGGGVDGSGGAVGDTGGAGATGAVYGSGGAGAAGGMDGSGGGTACADPCACGLFATAYACGANLDAGADPARLYLCDGYATAGSVVCPYGCHAGAVGEPDYCEGSEFDPCMNNPYDGDACGSNLSVPLTDTQRNTLYTCQGQVTVNQVYCLAGCYAAPPGQADACNDG